MLDARDSTLVLWNPFEPSFGIVRDNIWIKKRPEHYHYLLIVQQLSIIDEFKCWNRFQLFKNVIKQLNVVVVIVVVFFVVGCFIADVVVVVVVVVVVIGIIVVVVVFFVVTAALSSSGFFMQMA